MFPFIAISLPYLVEFSLCCQILRSAFEDEAKETSQDRLLLTAAVPAGKSYIDAGYEISEIAKWDYLF